MTGEIPQLFKTVIVIPALNPPRTLIELVSELISNKEKVVVINDGSSNSYQKTFDAVSKLGAVVLKHPINRGVGAALKTGMAYVANSLPTFTGIVTADADGQHSVEDILKLSNMLRHDPEAVILGIRYINLLKMPFRSFIGNMFAKIIFRMLSGKNISDTQSGLKAIPISIVPSLLQLNGQGFEYITQMLLQITRSGIKIVQEPIQTIYSKKISSHFRPISDSLTIIKTLIK